MYLSKIEIFGFKSFANKVEIKFNSGLTAIVGPNGCGKTNVVDAIRWVLGEQRTSLLRSDKMENVIFNGTKNRKPLGMAEVSLTIQNDKGILPIEYSEVTITRRLFRSGESEYLINKTPCRLKDIQNLFMDTGMSSNAYSVIELKMIENILSNRADDRRTLFEEAAGVNKYKHRRKVALKKLEAVKQDLVRVNDIYAEVQKKVNSLERQSKKAEQFNKLYTELRELEINFAERELARFNSEIKKAEEILKILLEEKKNLLVSIESLETSQHSYYEQLDEVEKKLSITREKILFVTENIHRVQEKIISSRERINNNKRNIARLEKELEENKNKLTELNEAISLSIKKNNSLESEILQTKEKIQSVIQRRKEYEEEFKNRKVIVQEKQEVLNSLNNELNELSNQYEKLLVRIQNNDERITSLREKIAQIEENISKVSSFIDELMDELYKAKNRVSEAESNLIRAQDRKEELEKKISKLKQEELETKSAINAINTKIEFIHSLIDNIEGISRGTKELLNYNNWNRGEKILVADAGSTKEKYRLAVDSILKNYLSFILLQDKKDFDQGYAYIKENKLGQANFYIPLFKKNTLSTRLISFSRKRNRMKVEKEKGFVGWLIDFIEYSKPWEKFFKTVLEDVCLVENSDCAKSIIEKYNWVDCVTFEGDIFRSSGFIEVSGERSSIETAFGRKRILNELQDILIKESYNLEKITNELSDYIIESNSIDLKAYQESLNMLRNDESNLDRQLSQQQFEKNKAIEEIEKINLEIRNISKINDDLNNQIQSLKIQLDEKSNLIKNKKLELDNDLAVLKKIEQSYNNLTSEENELKILLTRLESEVVNNTNIINRARKEIESIEETIQKQTNELQTLEQETRELSVAQSNFDLGKKKFEENKKILNEELGFINIEYNNIREKISQTEKELHSKRQRLNEINEQIHSNDLLIKESNIKIQNLVQRIEDEYQQKIEVKEFGDLETFNFEATEERIHLLKQKIRSLGPVNSLAFQEFEEEKKRLEFLTEQRNDLLESEKELMQIIDEINRTAQKQFLDTFEQIRKNFIDTFRTLFDPGDEADLRLEEGVDPLEAKIEIIAKPKGKRPTSIDLLSQGEKTLTATALLFAIYLVKPSPFCILDEVDAPLDDANIKRFIRLINKFSENTQFIIVTHNKLTMEAAQTLYGVTMEEEGVSKIVAVRFTEEVKIA